MGKHIEEDHIATQTGVLFSLVVPIARIIKNNTRVRRSGRFPNSVNIYDSATENP
jgi:hypothetical protein